MTFNVVLNVETLNTIKRSIGVSIKDAFGNTQFESEAIYPEGENNIRVGVGNMQEGLYFVTLHSAWEEVKEIIIVEVLR